MPYSPTTCSTRILPPRRAHRQRPPVHLLAQPYGAFRQENQKGILREPDPVNVSLVFSTRVRLPFWQVLSIVCVWQSRKDGAGEETKVYRPPLFPPDPDTVDFAPLPP